MALNQDQLDMLGMAITMAKAGVGFIVEGKAKRAIADGLVQYGHLVPVEGVAGGYMPSEQLAKGMLINTAVKAEQAKDN